MNDHDQTVRLVVIDDHALFRSGLINLISDMPSYRVVGEAGDGQQALKVIEETQPDLALIDVHMPVMDGIETVAAIRKKDENIRLVMLTISKEETDLTGSIRAGADGYILKNAEPEELERALRAVMADQSVVSPEMTDAVFEVIRRKHLASQEDPLTEREKEVLLCLADGLTTAETATELAISKNTVKTHVRHILEKLEVSNRAEAVSVALKMGLIE